MRTNNLRREKNDKHTQTSIQGLSELGNGGGDLSCLHLLGISKESDKGRKQILPVLDDAYLQMIGGVVVEGFFGWGLGSVKGYEMPFGQTAYVDILAVTIETVRKYLLQQRWRALVDLGLGGNGRHVKLGGLFEAFNNAGSSIRDNVGLRSRGRHAELDSGEQGGANGWSVKLEWRKRGYGEDNRKP